MLTLTISRPGSLQSILLDVQITESEAEKIEAMFRDRTGRRGLLAGDVVRMRPDAPRWREASGRIVDFVGDWAHVLFPPYQATTRVRIGYLTLVSRGPNWPTGAECPPSSITGQPCVLPPGHPADGPFRFHRYESPAHQNHVAGDTID
jgi:hypothetical protein